MTSPGRRSIGWLVAIVAAVAAASAALAELLLSPSGADRGGLIFVISAPALAAAAITPALRHWVSLRASVSGAVVAVGLSSLALGVVASSAASRAMFVSSHDYRLFLVMLVLSCGIAVAVGYSLTIPLAEDLRRLARTVAMVANGSLGTQTGIERRDEVGRAARAVDEMSTRLHAATSERERHNSMRRQMLTSLGHDLRTPLAAIRAAVESVRDGLAPDPDAYLAIAERQVATCERLLSQLAEYARLESMPQPEGWEALLIDELVDETVEALRPLAAACSVEIVATQNGRTLVRGNPFELGRALRNLLDNAIRHCPPNGRVTVVVAGTESGVYITVIDEGDGFPKGFKAIAFEPFTQADRARSRPGVSGLGLAIAKAVIEAHGGSIEIAEGPGGVVVVRLEPAPVVGFANVS